VNVPVRRTHFERVNNMKIFFQAGIALIITVIAFFCGLLLCQQIPGTGVKYINVSGQTYVGLLIFMACLLVAYVVRFKPASLFIATGLTIGFLIIIGLIFGGNNYLSLSVELLFVSFYTAMPVLAAGLIYLITEKSPGYAGKTPGV
jgi:hypothetical protein